MSDNTGYIKIYRKIRKNPVYQNANGIRVWLECLLSATHKPCKIDYCGSEVTLNPGEFVFGRIAWAKKLKISEKSVRGWICKLTDRRMITGQVKGHGRATIYKIEKWEEYQDEGQLKGQPRASLGPTEGQLRATNKNGKNVKNDKNIYSSIESIKTDELLKEISLKFRVTEKTALTQREAFCDWCAAKGKTFKNYKAAYTNWVRKSIEYKPDLVIKNPIQKYEPEPDNFTPVAPERIHEFKKKAVESIGKAVV